ncbi:DUF1353 domain-containing protein [Helicobacter sp. MIT 11-5569]|nr:DUF1353 domain-containing protein [Helicobacter sp. MIT 11-5569]
MRYVVVPKGFNTDFGSVPQLFQSLVSPVGNATKAYVVHDFLCVLSADKRLSRKEADEIFKAALKQVKINAFLSSVLYGAVRLYAIIRGLK